MQKEAIKGWTGGTSVVRDWELCYPGVTRMELFMSVNLGKWREKRIWIETNSRNHTGKEIL